MALVVWPLYIKYLSYLNCITITHTQRRQFEEHNRVEVQVVVGQCYASFLSPLGYIDILYLQQ